MKRCRLITKPMGLAALLALLIFATPLIAAEIEYLTLDVNIGGSELVEIREPSRKMKILISNQEIVGARPLKADLINVYNLGKKVGYSRITVWDEYKREVRAIIDVNVNLDVTPLKQKLHQLYPNQDIKVHSSESGIVLSGTVSGPEVMEQALRLARTFLPPKAEGDRSEEDTGKSGDGITNLMSVGGIQQVLLEVKFAEVTRTSGRDLRAALGWDGALGDNIGVGGIGGLNTTDSGTLTDGTVGSLLLNFADFADNPANIFIDIGDFSTALRFLEEEGLARLLAEPRLVTQSGQEASFLAGGEFSIPVRGENGTISLDFKEFGVALRFTPVVLSNGKISLRVAPSVSDLTSVEVVPFGDVDITTYNLTTRKLESTVQLYDGQTLALAGLLQETLNENVSKIPILGDLPIIGALFRSTSYQENKTDLMISVTPHLVSAQKEGTIKYPGENMQIPNRYEFYLEGRLEGRRSPTDMDAMSVHSFNQQVTESEQGGLEGSFGHEPVTAE